MKIQEKGTYFPSHVIRRAAYDRLVPKGSDSGYRTRNGAAQAHFDRYMETLQA